jgi:serine protease Do
MSVVLLLALLAQSTGVKEDTVAKPKLVEELESMAERAADIGAPAVVSIFVEREADKPATPPPQQQPPRQGGRQRTPRGPGVFDIRPSGCAVSGTIIDPAGLIVTSYFNVDGKIKKLSVQLPNGETQDGELVGFHGPLDLALIKVKATGLSTLAAGEVKKMFVGQSVYALGRSPEGNHLTLNAGVVSAMGRFNGKMIQHDGETNYGNSGGPLVDAQGRLLGITSKIHTKYAGLYGQNSGIAFSTPLDKILEVLPQLKNGAKIEAEKRAYVGVQADLNSSAKGAAVQMVQPNTPAAKAGIKNGDLIIMFDGVKVESWDDFTRETGKKKPGDKVIVKVKRADKELDIEVVLGERVVD